MQRCPDCHRGQRSTCWLHTAVAASSIKREAHYIGILNTQTCNRSGCEAPTCYIQNKFLMKDDIKMKEIPFNNIILISSSELPH